MGTSTRPTVELDPRLYRALKRQARGSKRSLTRLVNRALLEALEDAHDLAIARRRLRSKEKGRPFEEFVRELRREGKL